MFVVLPQLLCARVYSKLPAHLLLQQMQAWRAVAVPLGQVQMPLGLKTQLLPTFLLQQMELLS